MNAEIKNAPPPPKQTSKDQAIQQLRISTTWKNEHRPIQTSQNNKTGH